MATATLTLAASGSDVFRRLLPDTHSLTTTAITAGAHKTDTKQYGSAMVWGSPSIPAGSVIVSATLSGRCAVGNPEAAKTRFRVWLGDAPDLSTKTAFDNATFIGGNPASGVDTSKFTSAIDYDIAANAWVAGNTTTSPNLASLVQAWVDAGGYSASHSLALLWDDFDDRTVKQAAPADFGGTPRWSSWDDPTYDAPTLVIAYEPSLDYGSKRLYLNSTADTTTLTPRGTWDRTAGVSRRVMSATATGNSLLSMTENTNASNHDELGWLYRFPEMPAARLRLLTPTVKMAQAGSSGFASHLYCYLANGDTVRTELVDDLVGSELAVYTSTTTVTTTRRFADQAVEAGDYLVIEVGTQSSTLDTNPRTAYLYSGGDSYIDVEILRRWDNEQHRPDYIYDDRFTLSWATDSNATAYKVYVGTVGFTIGAGTLVTTINDNTVGHYTVTGKSASTEYECVIAAVIGGVEYFSRFRHVTTTEANAHVIMQDGDVYFGQSYFSWLGSTLCIGYKPAIAHAVDGSTAWVMDCRSDAAHHHFNYIARQLASGTFPFSGYYATFCEPDGADHPVAIATPYVNAGSRDWLFCRALDDSGFTFEDVRNDVPFNTTYTHCHTSGHAAVKLSDGSVLAPLVTFPTGGSNYDRTARVIRTTDGEDWAVYGTVWAGDQSTTNGGEFALAKISGTFPNETIVALIAPKLGYLNPYPTGSPYLAVSTDSGATWAAASETNIGSAIGSRYFAGSAPSLYYDPAAGRLWAGVGYRNYTNATDANNGSWLFYTDDPTSPSNWVTANHVATSTRSNDPGNYNHTSVVGVGDEVWVAFTECVGTPLSQSGTSNPYVGFKAFAKSDPTTPLTLTKYTPETNPYETPDAPVITATANNDGSISVTYPAVTGAVYYQFERRTGTDPFAYVGESSTTEFVDTDTVPGTTYDYRAIAFGSFETSAYSNIDSATASISYEGAADYGVTFTFTAEGHKSVEASASFDVALATEAAGSKQANGEAAFGLALGFDADGEGTGFSEEHDGAADFGLALTFTAQGHKGASGQAAYGFAVSLTAGGSRFPYARPLRGSTTLHGYSGSTTIHSSYSGSTTLL